MRWWEMATEHPGHLKNLNLIYIFIYDKLVIINFVIS